MENSYQFFKNEQCKFFPCHKGIEEDNFNCLFCYCPLNRYENCPGTPEYIDLPNGKRIKDCSKCVYPHKPENYETIIKILTKKMAE